MNETTEDTSGAATTTRLANPGIGPEAIGELVGAPTVLHVSHTKSGSTWLTDILQETAPARFVPAIPRGLHFETILPGRIYPRVYRRREVVEAMDLPANTLLLVSIRDLRDTLISGYWSLRDTHIPMNRVSELRRTLRSLDLEAGLLHLIEEWLPRQAAIQESWADCEHIIRYEDLVADDVGVLVPELSGRLGLGTPEGVRMAVETHRFERAAGGRSRGVEDRGSHYRKGIAGDWRNYMPDGPVKEAFKERYAGTLILTGYESDDAW